MLQPCPAISVIVRCTQAPSQDRSLTPIDCTARGWISADSLWFEAKHGVTYGHPALNLLLRELGSAGEFNQPDVGRLLHFHPPAFPKEIRHGHLEGSGDGLERLKARAPFTPL